MIPNIEAEPLIPSMRLKALTMEIIIKAPKA